MSVPPSKVSYQQGGMVSSFQTVMANLDSPAKLIYGLILILVMVYSPVIPTEYRVFANSLLGKIIGITIVYGVIESLGWIYGLLTALSFLLILNGSPRLALEAFDGGGTVSEKKLLEKDGLLNKC